MYFQIEPIARIENDYTDKFGIPRQPGLLNEVVSRIVFEPAYRVEEALRGIEDFEYLWLIWLFHENRPKAWSPTVRPPRLGGNRRMGVFATRSPYRPNGLGLSSVRLLQVERGTAQGTVLHVAGADLKHGTPIVDVKPYLPYADAHEGARSGFAAEAPRPVLAVHCAETLLTRLPQAEQRQALLRLLALDPRPPYRQVEAREYGFSFAGHEVRFRVEGENLFVINIF